VTWCQIYFFDLIDSLTYNAAPLPFRLSYNVYPVSEDSAVPRTILHSLGLSQSGQLYLSSAIVVQIIYCTLTASCFCTLVDKVSTFCSMCLWISLYWLSTTDLLFSLVSMTSTLYFVHFCTFFSNLCKILLIINSSHLITNAKCQALVQKLTKMPTPKRHAFA